MVEGEAAEEDDEETSVRLALETAPRPGAVFQLESAEIEVIALPFR